MAWKPLLDEARWNCWDNPERAADLIRQAILCADAETDDGERARALDLITDYLVSRELWEEASALYSRLIDLLRRTHASPSVLVDYLARHAEAESSAGCLEAAAELIEAALTLWRESSRGTLAQGAGLYNDLAEIREVTSHWVAASAARSRAVELSIEVSGGYYQPRVMRHARSDGTVEFAIHEVYFAPHGKVDGYTKAALSPRLPSVAALREWLEETLQSAPSVTCGDLGYTYSESDFTQWLQHLQEEPLDYEKNDHAEAV
jgi:tetratricopeptide (TPR) repeat protein